MQACIYRGQFTVMRDQLTEMKEARKQAKIDNANAITAQQGIAQDSLAKSQENFDKSLRETQDSFRNDQRPWIGVSNQVVWIFNAKTLDAAVEFTNTGKTPARKVQKSISVTVHPLPLLDGPTKEDISKLQFYGSGTIAPQAKSSIQTLATGSPEAPQQLNDLIAATHAAIDKGIAILYVFGMWKYADVNNRPHSTKFCLYLVKKRPGTQEWGLSSCDGFNEMD